MPFDTKEELSRVCEMIIGYQKGLEEIEKYISRLNQYITDMDRQLKESNPAESFATYGKSLAELQEQIETVKDLTERMSDGQRGFIAESRIISRFNDNVERLEKDLDDFNIRVDSLSKKLYNRDFQNAIETMKAIAEDSRESATSEYHHVTDHDYDILQHEYETSLKECLQKDVVRRYIVALTDVLIKTRLRREEFESLQRLSTKMLHSDSNALKAFLQDVQMEEIQTPHA